MLQRSIDTAPLPSRTSRLAFGAGWLGLALALLVLPRVDARASQREPRTQDTPHTIDELLAAVPEDMLGVLAVRQLDSIRERWRASAWFRFLQDADVKPLVAALGELMTEELDPGELDELGLDPMEWLEAVHGPLVAFATSAGEPDVAAGLLVDPGAERDAFDELLDELLALCEDNFALSHEVFGACELALFDVNDGHLCVFEVDGVVAVTLASEREAMLAQAHGIIDRLSGTDASAGIAGSARFQEARRSARELRDVELYFDLGRTLELVLADDADADAEGDGEPGAAEALDALGYADETDDEGGPSEAAVLEALGVRDLRWTYLAAGIGAGEALELRLAASLPERGFLRRLFECLGPLPLDLARLVPREALSVSLLSFDLWGLYQALLALAEELDPDALDELRGAIEAGSSMAGIDIEDDLLRQVTGRYAQFSLRVPKEEVPAAALLDLPDELAVGSTTLIELREAETVELALDELLLLGGIGDTLEEEEFQGHFVSVLEAPTGELGVRWAFLEKALAFSTSATALRAGLRMVGAEEGSSVLGDERFAAVLLAQRQASVLSVAETRTVLRMLLGLVSTLGSEELGVGLAFEDEDDELLAITRLPWPDARAVERHFRGNMLFALERSNGVLSLSLATK